MAVPRSHFTCFVAQKAVVLGDREEAEARERERLEACASKHEGDALVLAKGFIVGQKERMGRYEGLAAAIIGSIENRDVLIHKLFAENLTPNAEQGGPVTDGELLCRLHKIYGKDVPGRLTGTFTFVVLDSAQGRVLAAASPTSTTPLLQARGPEGDLIISTKPDAELPDGCSSVLPIHPGCAKYGWTSDPQPYVIARDAPRKSITRVRLESPTKPVLGRQSSSIATKDEEAGGEEGQEPASPAPKKTRRGKRGGKNQKLRAEWVRSGTDFNSRNSMELPSVGSLQSNASFTSRADDQNWWRTDTPRTLAETPRNFTPRGSFDSRLGSFSAGTSFRGGSFSVQRSSLSAASAPFVPQSPLHVNRQSVAPIKPQASALNFSPSSQGDGKDAGSPGKPGTQPLLRVSMSQRRPDPQASNTRESPSEASSGKADAAWHEDDHPDSSKQQTALPASTLPLRVKTKPDSRKMQQADGSLPARPAEQTQGLKGQQTEAATTQGAMPSAQKPRRSKDGNSMDSAQSREVEGGSPRGSSPHKPPKHPHKPGFKDMVRAMLHRKPSQTDLQSGGGGSRSQRSSSHGNLVAMDGQTGLWDAPSSTDSSSVDLVNHAARKKPSTQSLSHNKAKSGSSGKSSPRHQSTTSWLGKKARSIFGKSKSCNDLRDMEKLAGQLNINAETVC